jgi:uncharacterized protein (TIGR02594 family)
VKKIIIPVLGVFLLSGCQFSLTDAFRQQGASQPPPQLTVAEQYVGLNERQDRVTLKEFLGIDPVRVEWCAAFVNSVLTEIGVDSTKSLMARSYLEWGVATDKPSPGDIMVFSRGNSGWKGHVGFYVATVEYKGSNYWIVLGGNQDNSVSYKLYKENYWRHLGTRTLPDQEGQELLVRRNWMFGGIPLEVVESD